MHAVFIFYTLYEKYQMQDIRLGAFEEMVLLSIAALLDQAYSVSIRDEIRKVSDRNVKLGMVHSVLNRLEKKGLITSHLAEATKKRGGRRKRYFQITHSGKVALLQTRNQREQLWNTIPDFVFKGLSYDRL